MDQDIVSKKIFQEISEISSDWVWEVDELGRYTYVSNKVEKFLGYKESEVLGKTPFDFMSKEEASRVQTIFGGYLAKKEPFKNLQNVNLHKDGHEVVLLTSGVPVLDNEGTLKGYRGTDKDITRESKLVKVLQNQKYALDQAQQIANIGHWSLNLETNRLYWSDQVYRIFDIESKEVAPSYETFLNYVHPDDRELVHNAYVNSLKNGTSYKVQHRIISATSQEKFVEERCAHSMNKDGRVISSIGTVHDITTQKLYEKEIQLASQVFIHSNSAILITDKDNKITTVNKAFEKMTGYTKEEVLGCNPKVLGSGWSKEEFYKGMWSEILEHGIWRGNIKDKKKSGELFYAHETIIAVKDEKGEIVNYIGISEDTTALIKEQQEKELVLTTSWVTGLKNRYALLRDLQESEESFAALIDINHFHQISSFYGFEISDKLLQELSSMINSLCEGEYETYHLQADSFVVTMPKDKNVQQFSELILKLIETIDNHIFLIEEFEIPVSVTGVIASDKAASITNTLDMCIRYARKNHLTFWIHNENSDFHKIFEDNLHWTKELKSAFKEDRIVVYFQPIFCFRTQKVERYESLVRVVDADGNVYAPQHFLNAAQSSNQMKKLTKTVFLKTLEALKACKEEYTFAINISFSDMQDPEFLQFVQEHLCEYHIAKKVCFEILETEGIVNEVSVINFIQTVHKLGAQIAIDDFGSGYANFENIIKLDIDIIKIDGSLIEKVATHQDAFDIVSAIISFTKKRKIKTIAEFVKNRSIFNIINSLGIDYAQGYYIDKPKAEINPTMQTQDISTNEPYKTLIYISQGKDLITYEEANTILNASWNNNRKNSVGGVLLYDKRFFVQLLNGPVDKVDKIFERISADKRHHTIRVLGEEVGNEIEFDEWNMGFLPKRDDVADIFRECDVQEGEGMYNASFENMKALLKKLTLYI